MTKLTRSATMTRRHSLLAGAAILSAPYVLRASTAKADAAPATADPILHWLRVSSLALGRLSDLDLAGRVQMTFMRGHMAEIMKDTKAVDYFKRFYTPYGKEFVQFDDYSFVLHHTLRILYDPWREENSLLSSGPLGSALKGVGGQLPEMPVRPASPDRRADAVKANWYSEVYASLSANSKPVEKGVRNEVLSPDKCVLSGQQGLDLIWASFLVYSCEVFGGQIPLAWKLVGSAIAARKAAEQMSKSDMDKAVQAKADEYKTASLEYTRLFSGWKNYHADTEQIHDPMFDAVVPGLGAWLNSLTPDLGAWTIKPITKDEMYAEVPSTILALRGTPTSVIIPEKKYWRSLQWAPPSNKVGARGMPPFDASYFATDQLG